MNRWGIRSVAGSVALVCVTLASNRGQAQPSSRGAPVLRTPSAGTPQPLPGAPSPPDHAKDLTPVKEVSGIPPEFREEDPTAKLNKSRIPEIEFKPKNPDARVSFNLDDVELPELVKAISNITGRRFIYGGKLRQIKATVYSPEKVTVAEAYSAFLSILETNGLTVIPHGRFLKIIETPGIVTQTTPVLGALTLVPVEDRFVTRIHRVANVDAMDVGAILARFKSKHADITVYPPGNLLILTDTGSNIERMLQIAGEVDVGGAGEQLFVEPVHYSQAADLANKLNEILDLKSKGGGFGPQSRPGAGGPGGQGGQGPSGVAPPALIAADDRTNSLIITSTNDDYLRLLELIKRLDVPQSGEGEIHVLPLQHAGCKELSQTLNQILGTGIGASAAFGARPPGSPASAAPAAGMAGARPGAQSAGITDKIFEGQIRVTCDEPTNSIVTTSSLRDYGRIKPIIDKLDNPRRQVFIEAVIMDVSVDRSTDTGISYHAGAPIDFSQGQQGLFYGGNNITESVTGIPSNLEALAVGVRGPDIAGSSNLFGTGVSIPALGVVMHAVAQDGDSNVLATPHILATDNIAAEISIGQNIPLQTNIGGGLGALAGQAGAAGGLGGLGLLGGLGGGFNAPRQDIGTKIKVIPHVNDSDQVRLELTEEVSDAGSPLGAIGAIPINKRTATTTLIVRDQQTVVIGGLMRDSATNSQTKIPVLGDIPVLGALFRQTQHKNTKTNLLLVLTPYIIRDQDDLRGVFERKMQERQEFLDRYFVFSDESTWEPPHDFRRSNGLVEDIRQEILHREEKERLDREAKQKGSLSHDVPAQPIPLPTLGGGRPGNAAASPGGKAIPPPVRLPTEGTPLRPAQ